MNRNENLNSTGNSEVNERRTKDIHQRQKIKLETVVERSNEMSYENTERQGQHLQLQKTRGSSPFIVERIDYDLGLDTDQEMEGEKSLRRKPKAILDLSISSSDKERNNQKELSDHEKDFNIPSNTYRTPLKTEGTLSGTDSVNSARNGFFSFRKKNSKADSHDLRNGVQIGSSSSNPNGSNAAKIKIVNNIFQNTYLQNVVKQDHKDAFKKKIIKESMLGSSSKDKKTVKRKGNASMEMEDTPKAKRAPITALLRSPNSPKANPSSLLVHTNTIVSPTGKTVSINETSGGTARQIDDFIPRRLKYSSFDSTPKNQPQFNSALPQSESQELAQYRKFHSKVLSLMKDLGREPTSSLEEDKLKQSWRFIKDIVEGYVESKKKIIKLEEILKIQ